MVTDSELIMLVREKNEEALEILINRYTPYIRNITNQYSSSLRYLGITRDEIYNEGLNAILLAIDNYDDYKSHLFSTYVKSVVNSNIKRILSRSNKGNNNILNNAIILNHKYIDEGISLDCIIEDPKSNLENNIIEEGTTKEIMEKIKGILSSFEYQVLNLRKDGLDIKDIARITNKDNKTIYNTLYRVKIKIRKILENS